MTRYIAVPVLAAVCLFAPAAQAALPQPVRAMIEAAFEEGDEDAIDTVVDLAKRTNPDDAAEVDAMLASYTADRAERREQRLRNQGLFEGWSGEGQLGFSQSSGNSDNLNLSTGLTLQQEGLRWRHQLRARADLQRSNGVTRREQYLAAYEPNYKFNDRLFAYGLAQYERDRFQGYSARYTVSGGLGYRVIAQDDVTLDLRAGPAWRRTELVTGGSDSSLAGLASADFKWEIAEDLNFRQRGSALVESGTSTFTTETSLETVLTGALSARLSYLVEYESDPPAGRESTDTTTRATIVYGF